ncbi:hypothetical protein [Sphingomonas panacisoli]|nr:hypothetical protein [Sphingomonas panacisoli]
MASEQDKKRPARETEKRKPEPPKHQVVWEGASLKRVWEQREPARRSA